ncbi:helix-turn-helix domain-containing protein [Paenibacillus naphthalenovorans]|uniref:helix-turn-helix domain-containing protein n=1 Tax=Paenibacillus naphthalenovorans TaxID=162209 RepID=UPI000886F201|nr:helix-turn-helix domain-containing protein [Paenibacillus naphthalenovorans]SDI06566.1 NitT/TauT family transport system substrate-binding protein [Paenibacillus naphthalenovorans]
MLKEQFNLIHILEVMELLDVSRSTIDRWRKFKQLPSVKIGKEIYFDRNEVLRWYRELSQMRYSTPPSSEDESLTIGYTTASTHMWSPLIIKEFRLLEGELKRIRPHNRIEIKWHKAKDGMELVKGMVAGQIQLATFGDYALAVSHTISKLLPDFRPVLLAAGGKSEDGKGFGMVVPTYLTLQSISELAALPIATTFRTNAEYRLRKMLEAHSMHEWKIIHRSIEDSIESLRQGRISASIMWEPFLSLVHHQNIGKSIFNYELGLGFRAFVVADERWSLDHEDLTIAYLKAHLHAHRLIREQPNKAVQIFAAETGFPSDVIRLSISKIRWDAALYQHDLNMMNYFDPTAHLGQNTSPESQMEISYNIRYLSIAAQELQLPALPLSPMKGAWQKEVLY